MLSTIPYPPLPQTASPLPFLHLLERLKTTKREGWRQAGINNGESIADHMYRMSIMIMLCPPSLASRIQMSRCIQMSLVHDMAECLVGDITPLHKHITKAEKSRRETCTMEYITELLTSGFPGATGIHTTMVGLFQEYEANQTLEAQFVHDIDKLEMVLQTFEYERSHRRDLSEFYHVVDSIRLPEMREWAMFMMAEREAFWATMSSDNNVADH